MNTPHDNRKHRLNHLWIRRAFLTDRAHRALPAQLTSTAGDTIEITHLDGSTEVAVVDDADRLAAILARDDLCRHQGRVLLLVNTYHHVIAIATGPPAPPSKLEVLIVSRMEDGEVVELIGDDPQPSWQTLALKREVPAARTKTNGAA